MIKYHVVSYNHLCNTRKIFKDKEEIRPFLKALVLRCQKELRDQRDDALKKKLADDLIDQKEYDYEQERLREWRGFSQEELVISLRITAFDSDLLAGQRAFTE